MLFSRKSIGVEIGESGLAMALATGTGKSPCLQKLSACRFDAGTVKPSLHEQNILDSKQFSTKLKEAYNLLLCKEKRIAVSLPDSTGRIFLMNLESRVKNRAEALEIIRWKLGKSTFLDPADTHIDFSQLGCGANGESTLLVCMVSKSVIEQYENLFEEAGFIISGINLNIFNQCRILANRLHEPGECCLFSIYGNSLAVILLSQGIPRFIRHKELSGIPTADRRFYNEIKNSLLACREHFQPEQPPRILCVADPSVEKLFADMVSEASGIQALLLEPFPGLSRSPDISDANARLFPFLAATGAALGGL